MKMTTNNKSNKVTTTVVIQKRKNNSNRKANQRKPPPPPAPRQSKPRRGPAAPADHVMLTQCSEQYKIAVSDPFNIKARGACIPITPSPMTFKTACRVQFVLTQGADSDGNAFILLSPTPTNTKAAAVYSSQAWKLSGPNGGVYGIATANMGTDAQVVYNSSLPYSGADMVRDGENPPRIRSRIVSVGLKMTYSGPPLTRSGRWQACVSPNHDNMNGSTWSGVTGIGSSFNGVISPRLPQICLSSIERKEQEFADIEAVTGGEAQPIYWPYSSGEVGTYSVGGTTFVYGDGGFPAIIQFAGLPKDCSIVVDMVTHVEYTGRGVGLIATPTTPDQHGADIILTAVQRAGAQMQNMVTPDMKDAFNQAMSQVVKDTVPILVAAGRSYMRGSGARVARNRIQR